MLKCATTVSITTKVEQDLPLKMIQAAFNWDRSAYERVLSPEFYTFRKAVVDPPPLDFDLIGQNWEDSNMAAIRRLRSTQSQRLAEQYGENMRLKIERSFRI